MGDWVIWLGLMVLVALTLFATLNLALRLPSRVRIAEQFEKAGRAAAFEDFVAVRPRYMLATAVLRAVATLALLLVALYSVDTADPSARVVDTIVACVVALALVLIFGVAIPNAWAKYAGESLIVRTLPLLAAVGFVCYPVIIFLELFDPLVRRLSGVPVRDAKSFADELEQEILNAVSEGERHGAVDEEEKEMIESVIELTDTRVEEIMTPRTDVVAVRKDADLDTVLEAIRVKGHSRIPVYDRTIDTILGVLYAKDLLQRKEDAPFQLTAIMRKGLFIPESKLVRELLHEFQERKVHLAVVLDEYGGTAGLVTIEDILEELVGEITDEYDRAAPAEFKRIDDNMVEVDARMRIDDLNDKFDLSLPEDGDFETIGGFVFSRMGRIPQVGERCEHDNIGIQVIAAEPRRITRLRLEVTPVAKNNHAAG
ncbi:MAG: HlyC/CorC family transporter [Phycisphaerales bacterium]|nr:MAG: HlyC/CorC family transporter [Phycisphaerales bacterium]